MMDKYNKKRMQFSLHTCLYYNFKKQILTKNSKYSKGLDYQFKVYVTFQHYYFYVRKLPLQTTQPSGIITWYLILFIPVY